MTMNAITRWRAAWHGGRFRRTASARRVWYGTEPQQRPPRACVPYRGTVAERKRRNSKGWDCVPYHGTVRCAWRRPHRIPYRDAAGRWTRRGMLSGDGMPGCRPVRIGCRPACIGCRPRHRNGPVRIGGIDRRPVDRGPDAGVPAASSGTIAARRPECPSGSLGWASHWSDCRPSTGAPAIGRAGAAGMVVSPPAGAVAGKAGADASRLGVFPVGRGGGAWRRSATSGTGGAVGRREPPRRFIIMQCTA